MNNILVSIGPFNIYWYSVFILLSVLLGYGIAIRYGKRLNININLFIDMLIYMVPIAIIGARVYYVLFNFDAYRDNYFDIFKIWEGGLAIYGAIIASVAYIFLYCRKKNMPFVMSLDILSLSLLLGQGIGRWGNFFNQEAYGVECSRKFLESIHLPNFIIDGMYINDSYYHPTFLYESLWCFIGVIILYFIRKRNNRKEGIQISFYMIWYGIGRFFIESLRTDSLYIGDYRVSQIVSIILIIIGVIGYLIVLFKSKDRVKTVGGVDGRI